MKTFKIAIQVLVVFVITSCTSISKLYNSGSVPQEEFSGRIAFETMFDLIILPVEIEGKQYRFLFDTGAPMVISKELREQLELKAAAKSGVTDSQGKTERLDYVWLKEVKLAGIEFKKTGAIVADLRKAPEIACMDIDGILGANLMKLAHWKIDSKNNAMYFTSRKDQLEIPDSEPLVLPFKMKRTYTPVVDLVVDDSVEVNNATFDTGFAGYLSLGFGYLEDGYKEGEKSVGYGSTGLYGSTMDTIIETLRTVAIGDFQQVGLVKYHYGGSKRLLGMDFFNQFDVVMDWEEKQMSLYPKELEKQPHRSLGFTPKWMDGKLIVGTVAYGSEAEKEGLKVGDEIVKLNQFNFYNPSLSTYCRMMNYLRSNRVEVVDVEFIDGRQFRFEKKEIN